MTGEPIPSYAEPVLPAYGSACIDSVVPALLAPDRSGSELLPRPAREAEQVVLLVLDGLGWDQLKERSANLSTFSSMEGGPITSIVPSTTAAALTSITTGLPPAAHGVIGYHVYVHGAGVLNVLGWFTADGDARDSVPPESFQPEPPFRGRGVPVVTRAEFAGSGFTGAHLRGGATHGWRVPSSIRVEVARLLAEGERFVYAYYDGVDQVAHEFGLGAHYEAELHAVDRLVGDILADLPGGAALVVTADHGHLQVGQSLISIDPEVMSDVLFLSGEARFRWLHVPPHALDRVVERARAAYDRIAWVRTREDLLDDGWFGDHPSPAVKERMGDVALIARAAVAFLDPADPIEARFVSRHGSLTSAEMWVPLLAWKP